MEYLDLIQTAFNAALFVVWAIFLRSMLEKRFSSLVSLALGLVCFLLWFWISTSTAVASLTRTVLGLADLFGFALLIFKSRWPRVLYSVGTALAVMMLCEALILILFPDTMAQLAGFTSPNEDGLVTAAVLSVLILLINALLLWVASRIFGRYNGQLSSREWLPFALVFVSQYTLALAWYTLFVNGSGRAAFTWLSVAAIIAVAADIALSFVMRGMVQRAQLKAENALLGKQINAQKEHYAALTEQYENVRRMRHDIANHVSTIKVLLERGETAEAESYTAELLPRTEYRSSLGQCENPVVDAFLFSRIEELRGQGIVVSAKVLLPAFLRISNADLIIAFGNLLDNSAEACRGLASKSIELSAHVAKGYLVIETVNPLPEDKPAQKKRRIPELERGVGFSILRELAQRYDGIFDCRRENGSFIASLTLREESENAADSRM